MLCGTGHAAGFRLRRSGGVGADEAAHAGSLLVDRERGRWGCALTCAGSGTGKHVGDRGTGGGGEVAEINGWTVN